LYNDDTSFAPLFRLLDDFDNYARQVGGPRDFRRSIAWQPKFDIREFDSHYELHGELPGMDKDNVHLEFTEPQTLRVGGKVERDYSADQQSSDRVKEVGTDDVTAEKHRKAPVADEGDGKELQHAPDAAVEKRGADSARVWLTERSVGEFARSFSFPSAVDQDSVTASFKDGILQIKVPKAAKSGSRRITIS